MNKYLLILILSIISLHTTAQIDLEKQVKDLQSQLKEQVTRNAYLKEALFLRADKKEITTDAITIKLTRVYAKGESIYVEGLVSYSAEAEQSLQFSDQDLIDPKGNIYKSYNGGPLNDPKGTFHIPNAHQGIDYGFVVVFDNIKEKVPTISLLTLRLFGRGASGIPFNFKGVEVQW